MSESTTLVDQIVAGANAATRVNENFDAASPSMFYGRRASATTGLTWGYYGGRIGSTLIANGTVALTASATNYIVALRATGVVSVSTVITNWNNTVDYIRLYLAVVGASSVTSYEDHRQAIGAASSGGGGLTRFTESISTAAPNATVPVVQLIANDAATDVDISIRPKGAGAITAAIADNASTGGNKRGIRAVDWQLRRGAATHVASGAEAVISGGYNNIASGNQSVVGGGRDNTASGVLAAIMAGFGQTASGTVAFIGGGGSNQITVTYAGILCGSGNAINGTGDYGFIGSGTGNVVSGDRGVVVGGDGNTASGAHSSIGGGLNAITRGVRGAQAYSAGQFAAQGDAQIETFVQSKTTTDATPTPLTAGNGAQVAANSIVLPNSSIYTFEALISVRQNTTGDAASFKITGAIKGGANAAATAILGTPVVTAIGADAGAAAWTVAAAANTTLGALQFNVTGEAAKTLRWVARVHTVEVVG